MLLCVAEPDCTTITAHLRRRWAAVGFDIVHPFSVSAYNAAVVASFRLDELGGDRLGLLIGNTRVLWPLFTAATRGDPSLASSAHPLNDYVESRLRAELDATGLAHRLYLAHHTEPHALPIQRLAELSGLASLAPSHLSIHPEYGPWFALRAALVLDVEAPRALAPKLESPCERCSKPCLAALERALAVTGPELAANIGAHADAWIGVRDACPVGREARYGSTQLRYHYTKDRALLD